MSDKHKWHMPGYGRIALGAVGVLFIGAVLIMWGWNTIAADFFGAEPVRFKHALAAEFMIAVVFALNALITRTFRQSAHDG